MWWPVRESWLLLPLGRFISIGTATSAAVLGAALAAPADVLLRRERDVLLRRERILKWVVTCQLEGWRLYRD